MEGPAGEAAVANPAAPAASQGLGEGEGAAGADGAGRGGHRQVPHQHGRQAVRGERPEVQLGELQHSLAPAVDLGPPVDQEEPRLPRLERPRGPSERVGGTQHVAPRPVEVERQPAAAVPARAGVGDAEEVLVGPGCCGEDQGGCSVAGPRRSGERRGGAAGREQARGQNDRPRPGGDEPRPYASMAWPQPRSRRHPPYSSSSSLRSTAAALSPSRSRARRYWPRASSRRPRAR